MTPRPYYEADGVTLYHGDATALLDVCAPLVVDAALVSDPPYGIAYASNAARRVGYVRSCANDADTSARDAVLAWWGERRALVFGSWKQPKPAGTRMVVYWDTGGALGMGDLSLPWKNSTQEVYVLGRGFVGRRGGNVLRFPPVQSLGRVHPFEKPTDLLQALVVACPDPVIFDPFCGVGSTLVAAKNLGRRAVGVEWEERYCEIAARRLAQGVLFSEAA
jgi:hypothetical protein